MFVNKLIVKQFIKRKLALINSVAGLLPVKIGRILVSNTYLAGNGLEVGALYNPLAVTLRAKVKYVDRMSVPDLKKQYPELKALPLVPVDIIDNGELLSTIKDGTQDFVIANQFLEHCQNPILTLVNFHRVLKIGGILYLSLPDKRYTFDEDRRETDYEHILRDYHEGAEGSRHGHFEEWVKCVEKVKNPADATRRTSELMEMNYSIHFHVWSQVRILEMLFQIRDILSLETELFLKNKKEIIIILRKA